MLQEGSLFEQVTLPASLLLLPCPALLCALVEALMSSQPFQQLQAHKDSVKDKLQGVLATVAKVPALIHADTSKEVGCMARCETQSFSACSAVCINAAWSSKLFSCSSVLHGL